MNVRETTKTLFALAGLVLSVSCSPGELEREVAMGFFVTSTGNAQGGDFGGLEGADERCQTLADADEISSRAWRAFLSASGPIHARDRIGDGPWSNADGTVVAEDLDQLFTDGISSDLMLDETGAPASKSAPPGREHDIVTGSNALGQLEEGRTCADWTSSSPEDRVFVGHHDWSELPNDAWTQHWLAVHGAPCDAEGMARQLGSARTYCFAAESLASE